MAKKSKKVIETKYEVGDIVYFMPTIVDDRSNVFVSVRKDMIVGINISQDTVEYVLKYYQKEVSPYLDYISAYKLDKHAQTKKGNGEAAVEAKNS